MSKQHANALTHFDKDGFALLKLAVTRQVLDRISDVVDTLRQSHVSAGMRNLLSRSTLLTEFATNCAPFEIASAILSTARPVRAILFDKTPEANWYVTWHQDLSIPVTTRIDVDGYGPWSVKDGVLHVQPPARILEQMVSIRIHLDKCSSDNGAIKFIAGSHSAGILQPGDLASWRDTHSPVVCAAERGDIIVMRPLILHSSSTSKSPDHRRVLHIEYAGVDLPAGIEWAQA